MPSVFHRLKQNPKIVTARRRTFVAALHVLGRAATLPFLPWLRRTPPPLGDAPRILLLRADGIGDLAMTSPLFPALRRAYPRARIDLLCNKSQGGLAELFKGDLDEILPLWPESASPFRLADLVVRLRKRRYDLAVDLRGDFRYALLAWLSGARHRVGFDYGGMDYLLTRALPFIGGHQSQEARQVAEALSVPLGDATPRLPISPSRRRAAQGWLREKGVGPEDDLIALHMAAIRPAKAWPRERFLQVAREWSRKKSVRFLLLGNGGDRPDLEAFSAELPEPAILAAGELSLSDMAAALELCRLFIGIDSGPAHIAAAVGCPTVVLFGPTDPARYAPNGPHCLILDAPQACHAACDQAVCARPDWRCMDTISTEVVMAAAETLLRRADHRDLSLSNSKESA